jgi:hypothetical protein
MPGISTRTFKEARKIVSTIAPTLNPVEVLGIQRTRSPSYRLSR